MQFFDPVEQVVGPRQILRPEVELLEHGEIPADRLAEVTVAIVDGPSADQLVSLPNLAFVQSTWAGVEAIIPAVPEGVAGGVFAEFRTSGLKRSRKGGDLEILSDWLTYLWSADGAQRDGEPGLW